MMNQDGNKAAQTCRISFDRGDPGHRRRRNLFLISGILFGWGFLTAAACGAAYGADSGAERINRAESVLTLDDEAFARTMPAPAASVQTVPAQTAPVQTALVQTEPGTTIDFADKTDAPETVSNEPKTVPSYEELQKELAALRDDLDSVKSDLKKKQNKPDTDKKFSCKLGGMLFVDALQVGQSDENREFYGNVSNQYSVRDVRLSMKGEGYGFLEYECTVGLNRDDINFKDVCLTMKNIPVANELKAGYFKVESNMGHVASIYDETFADFDSNTYTFRAGRRIGLGSTHYGTDDRSRLFMGIFAGPDFEKSGSYSDTDGGILLNVRGTVLPIYREGADGYQEEVWHIGGAYFWSKPDDKVTLRYRPTGWIYTMPYLMTGSLPLTDSSYSLAEVETAWQKGRFTAQSEGFFGMYDGYDTAYGVTAQTRWMFTQGAYRKYNKRRGCFGDIVVPENMRFVDYENSRCLEGWGAWEAAFQWSYTDLNNLAPLAENNANVIFGSAHELTTGLTWFWNPQTRWCFNWVHTMPTCARGTAPPENRPCDTFVTQVRIRF